jgi:hypothetical protein
VNRADFRTVFLAPLGGARALLHAGRRAGANLRLEYALEYAALTGKGLELNASVAKRSLTGVAWAAILAALVAGVLFAVLGWVLVLAVGSHWATSDQLALATLCAAEVAVMLAVAFGVYVVNQLMDAREIELGQRLQSQQRLQDGLETVKAALDHNHAQLQTSLPELFEKSAPWEVGLHVATWAAVQSDILPLLRSQRLASELAEYFAAAQSVARLIELALDWSVGGRENVAPDSVTELVAYLRKRMPALAENSQGLCKRLDREINEINARSQAADWTMTPVAPLCVWCAHYRRDRHNGLCCTAFPGGIPVQILLSRLDHRHPVRGDHGLQFAEDPHRPPPVGYADQLFRSAPLCRRHRS